MRIHIAIMISILFLSGVSASLMPCQYKILEIIRDYFITDSLSDEEFSWVYFDGKNMSQKAPATLKLSLEKPGNHTIGLKTGDKYIFESIYINASLDKISFDIENKTMKCYWWNGQYSKNFSNLLQIGLT